jgi:hypothetical protein
VLIVALTLSGNRDHSVLSHDDLVVGINEQQLGSRIIPPSPICLIIVPIGMAAV